MESVGTTLISIQPERKCQSNVTGSPGVFPVRLDQAQKAFLYQQPQLSIDCLRLLPAEGMLISIKLLSG